MVRFMPELPFDPHQPNFKPSRKGWHSMPYLVRRFLILLFVVAVVVGMFVFAGMLYILGVPFESAYRAMYPNAPLHKDATIPIGFGVFLLLVLCYWIWRKLRTSRK